MKKLVILSLIIISIFLVGCSKTTVKDSAQEKCPSSCDDKNICTSDYCSENTNYECKHTLKTPCCGNGKCEAGEDYTTCSNDCERTITANEDLIEILDKNKGITNYKYVYNDGTLYISFWIKGDMIKEELETSGTREIFETKDDIVFLNTTSKTAYSYCSSRLCDEQLVARKTDYYNFIMETPLEFAKKIKLDAETIGEETIDNRPVLVVQYKGDDGSDVVVYIIKYYGVPTRVEVTKDGVKKKTDYIDMSFGSVKDSDFTATGLTYAS